MPGRRRATAKPAPRRRSTVGPNDPYRLPVRTLAGDFFRQTSPHRDALDLLASAPAGGRFHRRGEEPPAYASRARDTAWAEQVRHNSPEISPFEVKRRMSRLSVSGLPVLDLTDPAVRGQLGVTKRQLT